MSSAFSEPISLLVLEANDKQEMKLPTGGTCIELRKELKFSTCCQHAKEHWQTVLE